ncbi:MAG: aldehyde dehydrogenase family protein, partial [Anaerolineales bacterium]|nr:aldehyde dehydrogenase family protein [Anaerolineales bacterium]
MSDFKLTYATMFDPPAELHTRFEQALSTLKVGLGSEHGMVIDGKDTFADQKFTDRSPIDASLTLAVMQKGDASHARAAIAAAHQAFPAWSHTAWQKRIALLRRAADLIDERIFQLGAAMALEVGKNRMEALGDVAETADLIRYSCDQVEANHGFVVEMGKDPLAGYEARNVSRLRPYGVWLVISPFNFPFALTGGPTGAALAAGNTVVIKPATDTPWIVRLLVDCFVDAGIPNGVVNFVTGPGRTLGQALVDSPDVDGVTFTGSFNVGMNIYRDFGGGKYVRPTILELGGKNPAIVSRNANLERAAIGIVRSAFGLQGQKCSACSRVLVEEPCYDELVARVKTLTENLVIGDPTRRETYLGPVINESA